MGRKVNGGLELSAGERAALIEGVGLTTLEDASPELLSAVAKLKAGASAHGLGTGPVGDLSRSGAAKGDKLAEGKEPPAPARRARGGKRVDPQEVERLALEVRAIFEGEPSETFTSPQLARAVNVHDHNSGVFKRVLELLTLGKHIEQVGKWRNGPVWGKPEPQTVADGPAELPQAPEEPEGGEEPPEALDEEERAVQEALGDDADHVAPDDLSDLQQAILDELDDTEEKRAVRIAEKLGKPQPTIDFELRALEQAGFTFRVGAGWTRA